jgi:hypothetical protein
MFCKDHQDADESRDAHEDQTAISVTCSHINNVIYNKKLQEAARMENEELIDKMSTPTPIIFSEAMAAATADTLSTSPLPIFQGATLDEFLQLASGFGGQLEADALAFNVGYTGRQIVVEYLRFLTIRGCGCGPVLLWAHDGVITQRQAERELGFKYVELYCSTLKINARRVEDALQKRFQYLPLGTRLWRCIDKGAKYDTPEDAGKVHKVFLTYSPLVAKELRRLTIKLNA